MMINYKSSNKFKLNRYRVENGSDIILDPFEMYTIFRLKNVVYVKRSEIRGRVGNYAKFVHEIVQ